MPWTITIKACFGVISGLLRPHTDSNMTQTFAGAQTALHRNPGSKRAFLLNKICQVVSSG